MSCNGGGSPVCRGCSEVILDRYFLQIKEFSFHEECLVCYSCNMMLSEVCYLKNGQVFCKIDYDRQFRAKCEKCGAFLYPEDMVIRSEQRIWHFGCFSCDTCGASLQQGDKYMTRGGSEIVCKLHIPADFVSTIKEPVDCTAPPPSDQYLSEMGRHHRDGRRGPKRPRTILTAMQRRQFKASFEISPKPCRKVREALAKDTGLSVRVVQVWFQNQRAKMKKMQRRGKLPPNSPSNQDKTETVVTAPSDEFSDDSEDETNANATNTNNSSSNNSANAAPTDVNSVHDDPSTSSASMIHDTVTLPPMVGPNVSASSSSSNNNNNNNNSCALSGPPPPPPPPPHLGLMHHPAGVHHASLMMASDSLINPIDKLYMMQDSYFTQP